MCVLIIALSHIITRERPQIEYAVIIIIPPVKGLEFTGKSIVCMVMNGFSKHRSVEHHFFWYATNIDLE